MKTETLYQNVQRLPAGLRQEVNDFVSFLLAKHSKETDQLIRKPHAGCMKGTFTMMSDDFNAPLEDFNDYQ
ncbi:type II toxin-antitoxin system VapB family antitoxin [Breznakiellaceae bacterium SP9]